MQPCNPRMLVRELKRKLLLVALVSISAGGCAAPANWGSSFAKFGEPKKIGETKQAPPSSSDSDSWDALLAEATLSTESVVQPVGFDDAANPAKPVVTAVAADDVQASVATGGEPLAVPVDLPMAEFIGQATGLAGQAQTVDYFVDLAMAGHPSIQAARQRVSAEVHRIPQARALPDPKLNNTFWPVKDQSLQTAAGRVGNQLSLSQAIPWPEKLRTKAAIVSQEVQVAQAEVERIEREIRESVQLAYYEVWFATRAIAITEQTRDFVDDLTEVAKARYRSGGTQQDVLRARLESDRLDTQIVGLNRQKQVAQADLAALVQQPVTLLAQASSELDLTDAPQQIDELIALAEQCNPTLRGLAWEIRRDRQKHRLACLQKHPDFQVGVNWGYVSDDDKALSGVANGHDLINFNVGTTLPIWKNKINSGIREAANRTSSTSKRLDAERDALYGKLRRLLAQADAFTEQGEIYEKRMIPRTEDTLKLAIADYRGKRTDFFSLIETYRELLTFETQLARINASLAGTVARIERAVGCGV